MERSGGLASCDRVGATEERPGEPISEGAASFQIDSPGFGRYQAPGMPSKSTSRCRVEGTSLSLQDRLCVGGRAEEVGMPLSQRGVSDDIHWAFYTAGFRDLLTMIAPVSLFFPFGNKKYIVCFYFDTNSQLSDFGLLDIPKLLDVEMF